MHDNKQHWQNWAKEYGTSIRATTMTETAKILEIDAFYRRIRDICLQDLNIETVLEAGCGNGYNCIELAQRFPDLRFYGFDYTQEMIEMAQIRANAHGVQDRCRFVVADLLDLHSVIKIDQQYDIVITDRLLINLDTLEKQKKSLEILAMKVRPGGYLLMIENTLQAREQQNHLRGLFNLTERKQPPFNLFLDEKEITACLDTLGLVYEDVEDFSALHDFLLYVLLPSINGGLIDYDNPIIKAATDFSLKVPIDNYCGFYGQNRLFVCRKI